MQRQVVQDGLVRDHDAAASCVPTVLHLRPASIASAGTAVS
jgi:hypothetical protein